MITRADWASGIDFANGIDPSWQQINVGGGQVRAQNGILHLHKPPATTDGYANSQIDDYQNLRRRDFLWRPPLTFSIRARFSHAAIAPTAASKVSAAPLTPTVDTLTGTAGFGFWNDPFMMTDARRPTLPRAIWFFYSAPPSNMDLALDVPGYGWKAATIDAQRPLFYTLLPTAPIALPLMHSKPIYRALWPIAQRAINVSEAMIPQLLTPQLMTQWHTYRIDWQPKTAAFYIDDDLLMECQTPPRGPLGLVIWIDNQYMVVTPQGRVRHGFVASHKAEAMEIDWVQIVA